MYVVDGSFAKLLIVIAVVDDGLFEYNEASSDSCLLNEPAVGQLVVVALGTVVVHDILLLFPLRIEELLPALPLDDDCILIDLLVVLLHVAVVSLHDDEDDDGIVSSDVSMANCSSATFMSGTFLTSSLKKSNRLSDMMHCFMCDGDNVLAFLAFVIRSVLFNSDSTKSSSVLGVSQLRNINEIKIILVKTTKHCRQNKHNLKLNHNNKKDIDYNWYGLSDFANFLITSHDLFYSALCANKHFKININYIFYHQI